MTKSERIRELAKKGLSVADIAREMGVRYQHAYNVLKDNSHGDKQAVADVSSGLRAGKVSLTTDVIITAGFELTGGWFQDSAGELLLNAPIPKEKGVYAFASAELVLYVGVATMGLAKRLYFYRKPGKTQTTSIRIKALLLNALQHNQTIDVYTARPPDLNWNGLRVSGAAGLEVGIIECFHLPWNIRGAK